jgi:prepilin-type N-terminal cleavage/methylation domain-containing protein
MLFIRSQKGFSLIEAVVGMVLLAILVGAVLTVTLGDKTGGRKNLTFNASCKAEAQRILSEFKGKGLVREHLALPPTGGPLPPAGFHVVVPAIPAASEDGLNYSDRWRYTGAADSINSPLTVSDPTNPADLTILRPYTLIMGTISTLETLHNNFPAVCAPPGLLASSAPNPLDDIFKNPVGVEDSAISNSGLFDPEAYLQIQMFNTATGAPIAGTCGGTHDHVAPPSSDPNGMLNIFPPGMNSGVNYPAAPTPDLRIGQVHTGPPAVRFDAGYEVTIRLDYDGRDGTRQACSVTEKFQYPLNMADPARPLVLQDAEIPVNLVDAEQINSFIRSTTANDYTPGNFPPLGCNPPIAPGALNFRVGNARPGSVYMCRNLSQQRPLAGPGFSILAAPQRLNISQANGLRQTFYSSELSQVLSSRDNGPNPDAVLNARGFYRYNSLYYPFGTYFCSAAEGCNNLPRFSTGPNPLTTFANYDGRTPSWHASDTNTVWDPNFKTGRWVPCEYAQISCATSAYTASGAPPIETLYNPTAQFVKGSGQVPDGYHIQYAGLPAGCEVHMQVAEVDSAYNVRTLEFYEYTHETLPGNRLVHIAGQPIDQWHFVCTPAAGPYSAIATPCPPVGTVRGLTTAQEFDLAASCYIDFPGSPTPTGNFQDGVWRTNPANSEAGP